MPKLRITYCQDEGFSKGMWFYSPIDLRKKYYFCHHCQKEHLVKDGYKPEKPIGYKMSPTEKKEEIDEKQ